MIPCNWQLVLCGINHKTATLPQREPLQIGRDELAQANSTFGYIDGIKEAVILSTCNRVEFYMIADCGRELTRARHIIITACGTAWHAALVGEYLFEELARVPTETEYASEFRYRNPIIDDGTVVIAVSQSGETTDTLGAHQEAKQRGALTLGVVNVVGSTLARETDAGVYLHVGPETGVASTKAFTGQVAVLAMGEFTKPVT